MAELILTLEPNEAWLFNPVADPHGKLILQIPGNRFFMPRVRKARVDPYGSVFWDGKISPLGPTRKADTLRYDLLVGSGGVFQVTLYDSLDGATRTSTKEYYLYASKSDFKEYDLRSIPYKNLATDWARGGRGYSSRVTTIGSYLSLCSEGNFPELDLVKDRFDRILDLGVKGVDPEPELEEILDQVRTKPTFRASRLDISEEDLLGILDQVETRKPVLDEELEALLRSI